MSMTDLARQLPDYAKDLRLNMSSLLNETVLTDQQKYGTLLASALVAWFFDGRSALAVTGVMAGFALAALLVYVLLVRPEERRAEPPGLPVEA